MGYMMRPLHALTGYGPANAGSTDVNFFTSQVFALMGYDMLAIEFGKQDCCGKHSCMDFIGGTRVPAELQ